MARSGSQPVAQREAVLECLQLNCPSCGERMWNKYDNYRTVRTLKEVVQLRLKVRRCPNQRCERFAQAYRPEEESRWALPHQEFGLDVITWVGALRYGEHRSVPEIHQMLEQRGVSIAERSVGHLLERYDELVSLYLDTDERWQEILKSQQQVIIAIDGMQPDVGHEVLWVIRECISGEILLAKSLLSSSAEDLVPLLSSVRSRLEKLGVPISAVVSDGQRSIRKAVSTALPEAVHGLCHFHYLHEAAKAIYEADRHAKKELKKRVRGIRVIERAIQDSDEETSQIVTDYCLAVRSALTQDGRPPLETPGLKLQEHLSAIEQSVERMSSQGALPKPLVKLKQLLSTGLEQTAPFWQPIRLAYDWVHQVAHLLNNEATLTSIELQHQLRQLLQTMALGKAALGSLEAGIDHFLKVTDSYWNGLFHTYDLEALPRTNNDLERSFGQLRHHQRRATGRKAAPASLVLRGSVRLVAAVTTRIRTFSAKEFATVSHSRWQAVRSELKTHQLKRDQQRRFRRDPLKYLTELESRFLQLALPH